MVAFMKPLTAFIATCPFLLSTTPVQAMSFTADVIDGNVLQYVGTGKPTILPYTNNSRFYNKQSNFVLYIRRANEFAENESDKIDTAEFLPAFEQWVEEQDFSGLCPRFGDAKTERMWADNGMELLSSSAEQPYSLLQIQLHIEYQIFYRKIKE